MNSKRVIAILLFIALFIFLAWRFSNIVIYIFIALIIAIMGTPIMRFFDRISIKKRKIPQSISSFLSLIIILGFIFMLLYFLIPKIIKEFQLLASIDPSMFTNELDIWLADVMDLLNQYGILKDKSISELFSEYYNEAINDVKFANLAGNLFTWFGNVFIGTFSIIFLSFFAMKDRNIFFKMIRKFIPTAFRKNYDHILEATKRQSIRYFTGVFIEMLIVGTLDGFICFLLGIPNPVLIGVIGGLLNIIPYIGPLIALIFSIVISTAGLLPSVVDPHILTISIVKVICTFLFVKILDDFVLQPNIYGKSVNAHPIEIFLVILIVGSIGGILAMIVAVPAYSLVRIISKEFFGEYFYENPIDEGNSHQND